MATREMTGVAVPVFAPALRTTRRAAKLTRQLLDLGQANQAVAALAIKAHR